MERIYDDAIDKNVAAVIVYTKEVSSTHYAYKDSAKTEAFTSAELKDAFVKGCLVKLEVAEGVVVLYRPLSCAEATSEDPAVISILVSEEEIVYILATDPEVELA